MSPEFIRHDTPAVEALLIACWFRQDLGEDACYRLAADLLPDVDRNLVVNAVGSIADDLDDAQRYEDNPRDVHEHYDLERPPMGVSWSEWADPVIEQLRADARVQAEQLVAKRLAVVAS